MIYVRSRLISILAAAAGALILQGCGQDNASLSQGDSFASSLHTAELAAPVEAEASPSQPAATPGIATAATAATAASTTPDVTASPEATADAVVSAAPATPAAEQSSEAAGEPALAAKATAAPASAPVQATPAPKRQDASGQGGDEPKAPPSRPPATVSSKPSAESEPEATATAASVSPRPATSARPSTPAPKSLASSGLTAIGWDGFFDGSDQTRPSEQFWDLSGSEVTIKGFMGEVLSFEKNWFLLIPEPGAECPFDNGDETYWNKIMIVFVPDDVKLRYVSGPLQITGRLDVGIKIDDSGYKTMFRLYDASFTTL
ncbi:hypothetical protein [Paenibacillus donghaensis]|uniref:Uncharacterized protein n=1 Tax=Paenibacillus donghaensis TaxID=414771 RepID=A0A2Z2KCG7_9BACL|nr:hypothetical protein B9T62_28900 [Paenibacillus donghaensis]